MFEIVFADPFAEVPSDIRVTLEAMLKMITKSLDSAPREGVLWKASSVNELFVEGWRFWYRVDVNNEKLLVERAMLRGP